MKLLLVNKAHMYSKIVLSHKYLYICEANHVLDVDIADDLTFWGPLD